MFEQNVNFSVFWLSRCFMHNLIF